jgi:hypothetical protein
MFKIDYDVELNIYILWFRLLQFNFPSKLIIYNITVCTLQFNHFVPVSIFYVHGVDYIISSKFKKDMHVQRARRYFAPIKRVCFFFFLVFSITKFVIKLIPSGRWLWTKSRVTSWPPGRLLRSLICILTPIYNNNRTTIYVAGPIIIVITY